MVTAWAELTAVVLMRNFTDVCPAGTVTDAGTCATNLLLLARTTVVPEGCGAANVRDAVPVTEFPPLMEVGVRTIELRTGVPVGNTVSCTLTGVER